MTKRRVQGGVATSERRRRDGVYQKSARRTHAVLLATTGGVHELVAGSSAWQVRAIKGRAKVGGFALPATSYYHACEHSARKSRADSCTHCLHARWIMGSAGVGGVCARMGWSLYFLFSLLSIECTPALSYRGRRNGTKLTRKKRESLRIPSFTFLFISVLCRCRRP